MSNFNLVLAGMLNRPNRISDVTLGAKSGDSSANQEQRPMSPVHLASPSRKISTPHQITSAEVNISFCHSRVITQRAVLNQR